MGGMKCAKKTSKRPKIVCIDWCTALHHRPVLDGENKSIVSMYCGSAKAGVAHHFGGNAESPVTIAVT